VFKIIVVQRKIVKITLKKRRAVKLILTTTVRPEGRSAPIPFNRI
jgi:hypothetical protein